MPATLHVERHFTASESVRDIVIGMSDGLTVPFALAAGLSGAVAATSIVVTAGLADHHLLWFGIGGLIGAVLAAVLMDWAIIVLSSLVGAAAIVAALGLLPAVSMILFVRFGEPWG